MSEEKIIIQANTEKLQLATFAAAVSGELKRLSVRERV
jgi:hypothetical protein